MNDSAIPDDLQTAVSRGLRLAGFTFTVDTMLTVAREVQGMMTRNEAVEQDWLTKPDPADTDWDDVPGEMPEIVAPTLRYSREEFAQIEQHINDELDEAQPWGLRVEGLSPQPQRTLDLRELVQIADEIFIGPTNPDSDWHEVVAKKMLKDFSSRSSDAIRTQLPDVKVLT